MIATTNDKARRSSTYYISSSASVKRFSSESSTILAVYFVHSLIDRNEEFVSDTHSLTDCAVDHDTTGCSGNTQSGERRDSWVPNGSARGRKRPRHLNQLSRDTDTHLGSGLLRITARSAWSARAMGNPFDPYRYPYLLVSQMKDAW